MRIPAIWGDLSVIGTEFQGVLIAETFCQNMIKLWDIHLHPSQRLSRKNHGKPLMNQFLLKSLTTGRTPLPLLLFPHPLQPRPDTAIRVRGLAGRPGKRGSWHNRLHWPALLRDLRFHDDRILHSCPLQTLMGWPESRLPEGWSDHYLSSMKQLW